jgi:glycerol-3-phosphate dehydrogenase subunit B
MRFDAVVVGSGTAGMVAGVRLAQGGLRVLVVAKGQGSTGLAPGTIDVLGYAPDRVDGPAARLPEFAAAHPHHPYARLSPEDIRAGLEWLKETVAACRYVGDLQRNFLLPTAIGVPRPSAVVPESMAAGDLRSGGRFLICGLAGFKDLYPALLADNLRAARLPDGASVEARSAELAVPTGQADVGPLGFARRFEDPEFRKTAIRAAERALDGEEVVVGLPAVLGLQDAPAVWSELQDGLGRPVFEIPTPPPSVPGLRLLSALKGALRRAGGRLVVGGPVTRAVTERGRVQAMMVRSAAREVAHEARWFVLATGGFASGGMDMDSHGVVRETVLGLPVWGIPPEHEPRFLPGYMEHHPVGPAGVRVDRALRPVGEDGEPVYGNLHAAGAILGGAEPWREKSGDGISVATGYKVGSVILEAAAS